MKLKEENPNKYLSAGAIFIYPDDLHATRHRKVHA